MPVELQTSIKLQIALFTYKRTHIFPFKSIKFILFLKGNIMSQRGSRVSSPLKSNLQTYDHSYVSIDPTLSNVNQNSYSTYSIPNKNAYMGTTTNTYKQSRMTQNQVSQLTGSRTRDASVGVVKGQSRIEYVPYEKKVIDYETRTYTEMVPKTRKVVDYRQEKIIQTVPRQVVKQDYYAIQKITQYYKETIPEKQIEMVPVERKVKRIEYVAIEKQIIHYPQNQDFRNIRSQSRAILEGQGVTIKHDAEYCPIQSDLLYKYTNSTVNPNTPVGYVEMGSRRFLSTAPTYLEQNLGYSDVEPVRENSLMKNNSTMGGNSMMGGNTMMGGNSTMGANPFMGGNSYVTGSRVGEPLNFQTSVVYENYPTEQSTILNRVNSQNFNNVITGNKYQYRYGNVGNVSPRSNY